MNSSDEILNDTFLVDDVSNQGPPVHLLSDYIEMAYLCFVIAVGAPSNCFILRRLLNDLKRTPRDSVKAGFLILKINLNISDLLLLCVLAMGKLLWLATYEWKGGWMMCKVYNFLSMLALYISSNIVVCIALDRLRNVLGASKIRRGKANSSAVTLLVATSWFFAILWSTPQLYVWNTVDISPSGSVGWIQCSDIWSIHRFHLHQANATRGNESVLLHQYSQNFYDISHLFLVFWGPLIVLIKCYVIIAVRLMQYSRKGPGQRTCEFRLEAPSGYEQSVSLQHENDTCSNNCSNERQSIPRLSLGQRRSTDHLYSSRSTGRIRAAFPFARYFRAQCNSERLCRDDIRSPTKKVSKASDGQIKLPTWRRQLRSKVFRTTLLVVIAHFLFWFPYNFQAIMQYVNEPLFRQLSDHANIFKDLQLLITLINPFLYGFTH